MVRFWTCKVKSLRLCPPPSVVFCGNAIYECGEPTIGESWVQFDLRFYIVALFYLVFDVEVALIYPWAVVFREFPGEACARTVPGGKSIACSSPVAIAWDAAFAAAADPSGRAMAGVHLAAAL